MELKLDEDDYPFSVSKLFGKSNKRLPLLEEEIDLTLSSSKFLMKKKNKLRKTK